MEGACGVSTKMSQQKSPFAATIDKIVADCNDRLLWVPYSKDKLTKEAARVLIEQWSNFTAIVGSVGRLSLAIARLSKCANSS
jgi:hypothetical protein